MQADLIVVPDPQSDKTEDMVTTLTMLRTMADVLLGVIEQNQNRGNFHEDPERLVNMELAATRAAEDFLTAVDSGDLGIALANTCGRHPYGMVLEHHIRSGEAIDQAAIEREIIALKEDHPQEGAWLMGIWVRVGLSDNQNPAA